MLYQFWLKQNISPFFLLLSLNKSDQNEPLSPFILKCAEFSIFFLKTDDFEQILKDILQNILWW